MLVMLRDQMQIVVQDDASDGCVRLVGEPAEAVGRGRVVPRRGGRCCLLRDCRSFCRRGEAFRRARGQCLKSSGLHVGWSHFAMKLVIWSRHTQSGDKNG